MTTATKSAGVVAATAAAFALMYMMSDEPPRQPEPIRVDTVVTDTIAPSVPPVADASDTEEPAPLALLAAVPPPAPSRAVRAAATTATQKCIKQFGVNVPPGTTSLRITSDGVSRTVRSLVKNGTDWRVTVDATCVRSERETIVEFVGSKCTCAACGPRVFPCYLARIEPERDKTNMTVLPARAR